MNLNIGLKRDQSSRVKLNFANISDVLVNDGLLLV